MDFQEQIKDIFKFFDSNGIHINRSLKTVLSFLDLIGIKNARLKKMPKNLFFEEVGIWHGSIICNNFTNIGYLLHEIGHVAIVPFRFRKYCHIDMDKSLEKITNIPGVELDDALINTSDQEATAWAYAAGKHLGFDEDLIIRDEDYDGQGSEIRFALESKCFGGINGLRAGGMLDSVKNYPNLTKWTQD